MKIYFGHPTNTYDTELESRLLKSIQDYFPDYLIENPNQEHHQIGYIRHKQEQGDGMLYFIFVVLPNMDAGIFLAFEDGMLGSGVYKEAEWLNANEKPIFEVDLEGRVTKLILSEERRLSVDETRIRINRDKSILP